ncbi:MAG TPA: hypothetical protein VJ731_14880 [Terriglobales bacterium]|nr:hypothetical protein [Terriglobales bacterium]
MIVRTRKSAEKKQTARDRLEIDREDFALSLSDWSGRQIWAGAMVSAVAFGCFAYLLFWSPEVLKNLQTVAVALVVLSAIPWLGFFVRDFQFGKEGIRATLVEQQKTINVLKLITVALLTDFELEILGNLVKGPSKREFKFKFNRDDVYYESNKRTIIRLIGLGFLRLAVKDEGFGFMEDKFQKEKGPEINLFAKSFVVPTNRGRNFYELYERVHGKVDLDKLDEQTFNHLS